MLEENSIKHSFLKQALAISLVGASLLILLIFFGLQAKSLLNNIDTEWHNHNHQATTISNSISELNKNIGYGGFIHEFKNLILSRDLDHYQPIIEKDFTEINHTLNILDSLMKLPEEQKIIAQLRAAFLEYNEKYSVVLQMINNNKSSIEIDDAVNISDTAALEARAELVTRAGQSAALTLEHVHASHIEAIRYMQHAGAILLISILASIATLIFLLQRIFAANVFNKQANDRLENLLESSPDPMISSSEDGTIVRANTMAEVLFGYSKNEFLSLNIDELLPERYRHNHTQYREDFFKRQQKGVFKESRRNLVALTRDGREVIVDISFSHSEEENQRLTTVTLRDMTETIKTSQEQIKNIKLLQQAELMSNLGHWQVDIQTQQLIWSDGVYRIHNVTKQQYKPELSTAIDFYHPEDKDKVTQYVNEAIANATGWTFALRIVRPNGEIRHVTSKGEIQFNHAGHPEKIFGTFQDITELSELSIENELLKSAVNETTSGIVITDPQRQVVWINNAFTSMSGYTLDEVKGKSLSSFLQGKDTNQDTVNNIASALDNEQPIDVDILNYTKDHRIYWVNLKISPIRKNEIITHFVGIQHDVTAIKEQQGVIRKMQNVEMIGQLSAGIAHDFNNILGIISGYEELGRAKNTQPELIKVFDMIEKSVARATSLTQRLLKTSAEQSLNPNMQPLPKIIEDLKFLLSESIPNNISINWDIDQRLVESIDSNDLQDSILNLVINAKNSISANGNIDLTIRRMTEFNQAGDHLIMAPAHASEYIAIKIQDDGCGIPRDKFDSIFKAFESYSNVNGTGLGLAMVLGFVTRYNYGLVMNSTVGKGTHFSIYIPVTNIQIKPRSPMKLNSNLTKGTLKPRTLKIVLVDDEVELADVTSSLLESMGHTVLAFNIASQAYKYIESNLGSIDLIITDEIMPGEIQGHDLLKKFSKLIPMILVTGYSKLANIESYSENILAKPFIREDLKNKINSTLEAFSTQ